MELVHLINGPNVNLLGHPAMRSYSEVTLASIEARCAEVARSLDLEFVARQTNHEGQLVDWLQDSLIKDAAVVINAGALAFDSLLLAETVGLLTRPIVEVHMSNTHKSEDYKHSLMAPKVSAVICGLGPYVYESGIYAVKALLKLRSATAASTPSR